MAELEQQHKAIEDEIVEALRHRSTDDLVIVDLKRRKLHVKEQIERLRDEAAHRAGGLGGAAYKLCRHAHRRREDSQLVNPQLKGGEECGNVTTTRRFVHPRKLLKQP